MNSMTEVIDNAEEYFMEDIERERYLIFLHYDNLASSDNTIASPEI